MSRGGASSVGADGGDTGSEAGVVMGVVSGSGTATGTATGAVSATVSATGGGLEAEWKSGASVPAEREPGGVGGQLGSESDFSVIAGAREMFCEPVEVPVERFALISSSIRSPYRSGLSGERLRTWPPPPPPPPPP